MELIIPELSRMNKNTNEVYEFLELLDSSNDSKWDSLEDWFYEIANHLMNEMVLEVGQTTFRITECEIYYNNNSSHCDPYIHGGDEQFTRGCLYLNKVGGLDITFGNKDAGVRAGILIRGIRNIDKDERFNQVTKIVEEIFRKLGNIVGSDSRVGLYPTQRKRFNVESPIRTIRVGLTKREDDKKDYINKPYRYIVELTEDHKFRNKERVIKELLAMEKVTRDKARDILGYNLSQ